MRKEDKEKEKASEWSNLPPLPEQKKQLEKNDILDIQTTLEPMQKSLGICPVPSLMQKGSKS